MFTNFQMKDVETNKAAFGMVTRAGLEVVPPFKIKGEVLPKGSFTVDHLDTDEKFRLLSGAGWGLLIGPLGLLAGARKRKTALFLVTAGDRAWVAEVPNKDRSNYTKMLVLANG